ncbi:hypothetical protein BQ8794_230077 [Mesorhizobium prunaredense]|uniref:Uncharacterized protein n=1 Tax=Mesorhizobium prunaredense TaxID=1631249 RepID=A0A1R3VBM4_9HYPH|nr:hypothetical protein BQ8794_230077 [Mesorhizobium prunaredense]
MLWPKKEGAHLGFGVHLHTACTHRGVVMSLQCSSTDIGTHGPKARLGVGTHPTDKFSAIGAAI